MNTRRRRWWPISTHIPSTDVEGLIETKGRVSLVDVGIKTRNTRLQITKQDVWRYPPTPYPQKYVSKVRRGSSVSILNRCQAMQKSWATTSKQYTLAHNACGSCAWTFLYVTLLAPGISMWFLDFRSVYEPLDQATR